MSLGPITLIYDQAEALLLLPLERRPRLSPALSSLGRARHGPQWIECRLLWTHISLYSTERPLLRSSGLHSGTGETHREVWGFALQDSGITLTAIMHLYYLYVGAASHDAAWSAPAAPSAAHRIGHYAEDRGAGESGQQREMALALLTVRETCGGR